MREKATIYWTIAGFDGGGGAGVLADLETFRALRGRAAAAVTALTAQGRGGLKRLQPASAPMLAAQLEALLELGRPAAVKIGMLASRALVTELARAFDRLPLDGVPVVLDPVMRASAGGELLQREALEPLRRLLLPRATVITPNAREAAALLGMSRLAGRRERLLAARRLLGLGCAAAVLTGGDGRGDALDVLAWRGGVLPLRAPRLPGTAHGTGCRFSAALAVWLGRGKTLPDAVRLAAAFTRRYLARQLTR